MTSIPALSILAKRIGRKGQHRAFANTRLQIVMQRCLRLNNIIALEQAMRGKKEGEGEKENKKMRSNKDERRQRWQMEPLTGLLLVECLVNKFLSGCCSRSSFCEKGAL